MLGLLTSCASKHGGRMNARLLTSLVSERNLLTVSVCNAIGARLNKAVDFSSLSQFRSTNKHLELQRAARVVTVRAPRVLRAAHTATHPCLLHDVAPAPHRRDRGSSGRVV